MKQNILNKNKIKKNNGITLIALVITIIVLLILAAISIAMLTGQNGILSQAQNAKNSTEEAKLEEEKRLTAMEAATNLENQTYKDKNGDTATIPAGFAVSQVEGEDIIEEGLVVIDKNGNEFVWIPVDDYTKFQRQEGYYCGEIDKQLASNCEEIDSTGTNSRVTESNTTKLEVTAMYNSVKTYGGFYIGKFETGKDESGKIVIKKGVMPYINVPWSITGNMTEDEEIDGTENGAIEQARYFDTANGYTSVTSTLCYGVQWDAAMNFIDPNYITNASIGTTKCLEDSYVRDSTNKGWYDQDTVTNTGYFGIKNIYDLAGNVSEWTMESYNADSRVHRGGLYHESGFDFPSSYRFNSYPDNTVSDHGFRISLYLST